MGGVVSIRIFGHYVPLPLVLLMLVEAAIHVGAVYLAGTLRFLDIHVVIYSSSGNYGWLLPRALLYSLVMLGVMTAFGLYGSALQKNDREYQVRFLASYPAGALVMVIVFYVIPASFLGRGIMALSFLFSLILTALARTVFFRIVGGEALKRRVLVLGSGSRAAEVEALLSRLGSRAGFHLVGFVLCGDEQPGRDKSKLLGDCNALRSLVGQHRIDEIVVGVRDRRNGHFPMSRLLECKLEGTSIVDLPTFFERETGYVQLNSLSASWMVLSEGFSKTGFQRLLKREFDMSFVGPRPERPPFVHELSRKVPFYASRHSVKPGITGWAQVRYPYGASVDDAVQKLQFDLYYVKNNSLFLDLVILLQTAQVVLFGKGAR